MLAAVALGILRSAGHPTASLVETGRIAVRVAPSGLLGGGIAAMYASQPETMRGHHVDGDTMYLAAGVSATSLNDRGLVIHEAQHADQDARSARMSVLQAEAEAYRTHARYVWRRLEATPVAARPAAVRSLGAMLSPPLSIALALVARGRPGAEPLFAQIMAASSFPAMTPAQVSAVLNAPEANVARQLDAVITSVYRNVGVNVALGAPFAGVRAPQAGPPAPGGGPAAPSAAASTPPAASDLTRRTGHQTPRSTRCVTRPSKAWRTEQRSAIRRDRRRDGHGSSRPFDEIRP